LSAEDFLRILTSLALGFNINLFNGQFCLQAIHLEDQLLLDLAEPKKLDWSQEKALHKKESKKEKGKRSLDTKSKRKGREKVKVVT
jgi:hypothetical protein